MTVSYYFQDEDLQGKVHQSPSRPGSLQDPVLATTAIPLGFTTTKRPSHVSPRVKSNLLQAGRNRPSQPPAVVRERERNSQTPAPDTDPLEDVSEPPIVNPFDNPPFISVDGKRPRVKANINNKFVKNKNRESSGKKHKKQGSKRVELDRSQFHAINFISPTAGPALDQVTPAPPSPFSGPEVRPDGRVPRVKADVLAAARDQGQAPDPTTPLPRPTRPPTRLNPSQPVSIRPTRPPPSQIFSNSVRPDPQTRRVSPSTARNIFPPEGSVNTPQPIFSSTFRQFAADPPRLSVLSTTPATFPTQTPSTFAPPTFRLSPPPRPSRPNKFDLGPPPQPSLPASLPPPPRPSFNARPPPPPPSPSPSVAPEADQSPLLQRNRNRFGSRPGSGPRVKANELAQKANAGSRPRPINTGERESPRNRFASQNPVGPQTRPSGGEEIVPGVTATEAPRPQSRPKFRVRFKTVNDITESDPCKNPFKCPPRAVADGRKPRVKSNIKAARRNFWNPKKAQLRVIKKRKQGKLNAALWNRGIIRRGRKQNLREDKSTAIDNEIDDGPITTADPISSLKQIVASKEKQHSKTFSAFPAARSFQNKRLRSKQKINHRSRNAFLRTTTPTPPTATTTTTTTTARPTRRVVSTTPIPTAATTTQLSLFVTPAQSLSVLPVSRPTQSAPEKPFTVSDMGLFVTNPRALQEDQRQTGRNLFKDPPQKSAEGRRPRVKSNIMAKLQQAGNQETETLPTTTERIKPVLRIVPDGRSPRVKSDLLNKTNRKNLKKNKKHNKFRNSRLGLGRSLDLDSDNEIVDTESFDDEDNIDTNTHDDDDDYVEPEVRPDGRKPRIKSDLLAKKMSFPGEKKQKAGRGGFRHSKKVLDGDRSSRRSEKSSPATPALNRPDNTITTFRPPISLDGLMKANETLPPAPVTELSVPLPNFDKSIISTAGGGRPPSKGLFSSSLDRSRSSLGQLPQSVTEIVRVSSKDQNLFNSDYSYYDYYEEFINST